MFSQSGMEGNIFNPMTGIYKNPEFTSHSGVTVTTSMQHVLDGSPGRRDGKQARDEKVRIGKVEAKLSVLADNILSTQKIQGVCNSKELRHSK